MLREKQRKGNGAAPPVVCGGAEAPPFRNTARLKAAATKIKPTGGMT
jgi:hypothetical protein